MEGRNGLINQEMLSGHLTNLQGPIYYIAGPPAMVAGLRKMLVTANIDEDDIRTDLKTAVGSELRWVANEGSSSVSKLRASDGKNLGTFAVGVQPFGVAFDGANIWVTNSVSNTVTKLRARDGATLGTFAVGSEPSSVAFDGANVWVANASSDTLSKL